MAETGIEDIDQNYNMDGFATDNALVAARCATSGSMLQGVHLGGGATRTEMVAKRAKTLSFACLPTPPE